LKLTLLGCYRTNKRGNRERFRLFSNFDGGIQSNRRDRNDEYHSNGKRIDGIHQKNPGKKVRLTKLISFNILDWTFLMMWLHFILRESIIPKLLLRFWANKSWIWT